MAEPRAADERARRPRTGLRYRDFLTVALVIDGEDLFPDNWIYIHEPGRRGRPHPELPLVEPVDGAGPTKACVGLEYFCFAGDELWDDGRRRRSSSSRTTELEQLGLATPRQRRVRASRCACPRPTRCTTRTTPSASQVIRDWLDGARQPSSRSAATACTATTTRTTRCSPRCARWTTSAKAHEHDIWAVNAESSYHEEDGQDEQQPYIEAPETESMKEPLHS